MSDEDKLKTGYWSIATQKHLKNYKADSTHMDEFDSLNVAGKAGRLLGILRGNKNIDNKKKLEKMASSVGILRTELYRTVLPELEKASDGQIEIVRNVAGDIIRVDEYVFSQNNALEISGQIFENLNPTAIERIAVETMDATKRIPYLESELKQNLSSLGFNEKDVELACSLQVHFNLIQKLKKGREPIFSNEYIWGSNHQKIAYAVANLQLNKKQTLKEIIDIIQNYQGYPLEKLPPVDNDLIFLAKKIGMINPTSIVSRRGLEKHFGFSANLFETSPNYGDDIMDDVKLFLASIRFGENYTEHTTIFSPERFLSYFIKFKKVGPHSANGTDYTLLEERGIIKVEKAHGDKYFMVLLRDDIAREALKVIRNPNFNINIDPDPKHAPAILERGIFKSPEECRLELGKAPENVTEAMDYLTMTLRNETL